MSDSIEVKEDVAVVAEIIMQPSKAEGYMAFITAGQFPPHYWSQAYGALEQPVERDPYKCSYPLFPESGSCRDIYNCPYPLFPTREKALEACAKALPQGGVCKLVKIVL